MIRRPQAGALHILLPIVVLLMIGAIFVIYLKLSESGKSSKAPYFVKAGFDASPYDRQGSPDILASNVAWETTVKKADRPGNVFNNESAEDSYNYYLLGTDRDNGDKYYFAQQKPLDESEGVSKTLAQLSIFASDQIVFKASKDKKFTILSRMSPSLANYEDLDIENPGGKGKDGKLHPVSAERLESLVVAEGVSVDNDSLVANTAPPAELRLRSGIVLNYRGLSYGDQPIFAQPINGIAAHIAKKLETMNKGVVYELSETHETYKEKSVKYMMVMQNHTKAIYELRNDFNYPVADEIVWSDGRKNTASYVMDATTSRCKTDRWTLPQTIVQVKSSELVEAGKYGNGEPVYSLTPDASYAKQRYQHYKKFQDLGFAKDAPKAGSIDAYLGKHPFYLVDSRQGYHYVYTDPSFIYGFSMVDCRAK